MTMEVIWTEHSKKKLTWPDLDDGDWFVFLDGDQKGILCRKVLCEKGNVPPFMSGYQAENGGTYGGYRDVPVYRVNVKIAATRVEE